MSRWQPLEMLDNTLKCVNADKARFQCC